MRRAEPKQQRSVRLLEGRRQTVGSAGNNESEGECLLGLG